MRRKGEVTDEDLDGLLARMNTHGQHTATVLSERLAHPMPGHTIQLRIDHLDADPRQPRKSFTETSLRELSESIKDQGVLQPLVVRPAGDRRYLIVAGERRFRAARLAGLDTVPAIVHNYTDEQAMVVALVENVHRDDLTDIEKSDALCGIKDLTGKTWEALAEAVRLSEARVKQLAQLQRLAPEVQEMVRSGGLSGYKARGLLTLSPQDQVNVAERAAVANWSAERIVEEARIVQAPRTPQSPGRPRERKPKNEGLLQYTPAPAAPSLPASLQALDRSLSDVVALLQTGGPALLAAPDRHHLLARLDTLRQLLTAPEATGNGEE